MQIRNEAIPVFAKTDIVIRKRQDLTRQLVLENFVVVRIARGVDRNGSSRFFFVRAFSDSDRLVGTLVIFL